MRVVVDHISKSFKGTPVLKDISLSASGGEVVGFEGINGSGKTMLMRAICGLIRVDSGVVTADGQKIGRDVDAPRNLGILIEEPAFLGAYTGFQNLKMLAYLRGPCSDEELRRTLSRVGLDPYDKRKYKSYSLGMCQRLGLAAAIMQEPELIVLDEPTNALDADGVEMAVRIVREERDRGALVIIACHDRENMRLMSDVVYTMEDGRIANCEEVRHEAPDH